MEVPQQAAGQEDRDYELMKQAVDEAYRAAARGDGGPFGAVILGDDDAVVASCHNLVRKNTDPSAHAEVAAIRQEARESRPLRLRDLRVVKQKVVYGAKAEAAVAAGYDASIPDTFVEYYGKSGIEVRQVEGEAAGIAEQVFEKPWETPGEATRRTRTRGGWSEKAKGMVKSSRLCCLWN
ncbi:hypothetical protein PVAP13_2NG109446 [Panicum virgatum]|uniref:CMP/dCMP-type deaminase domain-containing protein n=1 Tax=Panicum virgatum TaxID=38727 RepID=A0A8T0VE39_PANVG|nr:hypothetical protein PVAP13_2NG109446 [Panicum virgatum]